MTDTELNKVGFLFKLKNNNKKNCWFQLFLVESSVTQLGTMSSAILVSYSNALFKRTNEHVKKAYTA